jgi:hypothetical protein
MKHGLSIGLFFLLVLLVSGQTSYAQEREAEWSTSLDSLREEEDNKKDSVVYTARYVRYLTLDMLRRGTYTVQIDTTHRNFQYFNPQNNPHHPSIHLGSYGLATRDLLFTPQKTLGFQTGFHALDRFLYRSDSVKYYRARAPFSELYNVGFFFNDQVLRAKISQNIHPRWNIGGEFHAAGADGYYSNQRYNDLKAAVFTWYESKNHRYNLLANMVFNKLLSTENGSVINDTLFRDSVGRGPDSEPTRLRTTRQNRPLQTWKDQEYLLTQRFYLGRIDTLNANLPEQQVLPTNRFSHITRYRLRQFGFFKNEEDIYGAFPIGASVLTKDSTRIQQVSNEFEYTFFLRGKSSSIVRNEVKIDAGFRNDLIWYQGMKENEFFQNNTVLGSLSSRFSTRMEFLAKVEQIVQGAHFGDYLYEAQLDISGGKKAGQIRLQAYTQNKSPEQLFQEVHYTYHDWKNEFSKTKTTHFSFQYRNPFIGFEGTAAYFNINNHVYYKEVDNPNADPNLLRKIEPSQASDPIQLLRLSLKQKIRLGRWQLDNYIVYQESDFLQLLATPRLYTFHSLYYSDLAYKVLDYSIGMDVRFNTPYQVPAYAINVGQFYNTYNPIEFSTYPIVDVWTTATIKRVNLFLSYNFVNQFVWPKGYYSVRRYPMNPANLRLGVSWKFYD